jgi:hypothetical protein
MSEWDTLSEQLMALDFASGKKLASPLDVEGDDDDAAHLDVLDDAADRVRAGWKRIQNADDAAKKRFRDAAGAVIETAKGLVDTTMRHLPHTVAAQALNDKAHAVKEKLEATAKAVLPWYLAVGVATWVAVGVAAWFLLKENEKQRPERERIAREYTRAT